MKTVCEKDKCTGCIACVDICSKSAIKIVDKLSEYNAVIDQVYPSLFVIKPNLKTDIDRTSFSYSDVLCGDITFLVEDNQTVDIKQEVE